jgi:hypothetical protein
MWKPLVFAALLFVLQAPGWAQPAAALVGKYRLDAQGGDVLELRADGTATLAGEAMKWSVRGNMLTVGTDVTPFVLQADGLLMTVGSVQVAWKRIGGPTGTLSPMQAAAARAQQPAAAAPAPDGGGLQDQQARQVLTGSAWCSFSYNKVSGTSSTRRVVFRPDGVMLVNGGAETYSSGTGGVFAGQSNSNGAMRWKFENLRLFIDPNDGRGFQDVGLSATQNSNGSVILKSLGREYAMCR